MSIQTLKKTPKPLIALKQIQTENFNDLQKKHLSDTELLEDIRQFCKQKAAIDREYAQSIQKIIQNLSVKKHFHLNESKKENNEETMDIWLIWKGILTQYDSSAIMKINTSDLLQKLGDQLKPIRINRLSTNKRILDQLKSLQTDLYGCVQEMFKAQKVYFEEEKQAHEVRIKAEDAAAKVRNKSTNIFNSMANLHRASNKLSNRLDAYQTRSTAARNEYLFQLAAINAHLYSYFHKDLGDYAEIIDADIYDKLKEVLVTITNDEQKSSLKQSQTWLKLIHETENICRDYHWQYFLNTNLSFTSSIDYKFQPIKGDKIKLLIPPNPKEDTLANVTKKLVKRLIVREHKIMGYEKEIKSFETGKATPPQTATLSPNADSEVGVEDLISYNQEYVEHKVEELRFAIRKEKIEKVKIEACLSLLKDSGVNTDTILYEARDAVAAATEMMRQGSRNSEMSYMPTDTSESVNQFNENMEIDEELNQINNFDSCGYSISKFSGYEQYSSSGYSTPNKQLPCNHSQGSDVTKASCESFDSSSVINNITNESDPTNDNVQEVVNETKKDNQEDEEDWVGDGGFGRAITIYEFQSRIGQLDELDLVVDEEVILLSEFDKDGWIKVRSLMDGREGIVPISYIKIVSRTKTEESAENINDYENIQEYVSSKIEEPEIVEERFIEGDDLVRAAYVFVPTNSDEMSLEKNDVVKVVSRLSEEGVDDGWWEGLKVRHDEVTNKWIVIGRGFFPSMVVAKYNSDILSSSSNTPSLESKRKVIPRLHFENIRVIKDVIEIEDKVNTAETDPIGDYVRLASETESKDDDESGTNLEIKEL